MRLRGVARVWMIERMRGDGGKILSGVSVRSVPFGKYWRRRPLVFSLVPRCQGL